MYFVILRSDLLLHQCFDHYLNKYIATHISVMSHLVYFDCEQTPTQSIIAANEMALINSNITVHSLLIGNITPICVIIVLRGISSLQHKWYQMIHDADAVQRSVNHMEGGKEVLTMYLLRITINKLERIFIYIVNSRYVRNHWMY